MDTLHSAPSLPHSNIDSAFRRAFSAEAEAIATLVNSAYRGDSSRAGWTTKADAQCQFRHTSRASVR